jgi:hypothetical protein
VLTAENAAKLSWVVAKQLLPRSSDTDTRAATLIYGEPSRGYSLTATGQWKYSYSAKELLNEYQEAKSTLILSSHSRPHCGLIQATDGIIGVCGLPTGGAGGVCVDGSACHFGESPRAILQESQAERIYFNGCTTAGVGTRRQDFLPRAALLCHAASRSNAREFVGNVRAGYYGEMDVHWFLAGSALGYTPAECVGIVESSRKQAGHEAIGSCLYFGDPTNPPWPTHGVVVGTVRQEADRLIIHWASGDRLLAARVPGRMWATLALEDRLSVRVRHPCFQSVTVIPDPWEDRTIVMAVVRAEANHAAAISAAHEIALCPLAVPMDRALGKVLSPAIAQLRWLALLPSFAKSCGDTARQLEEELLSLRRMASVREDLLLVDEKLDHLRGMEIAAATRYDAEIVDKALSLSMTRWNWSGESAPYLHATPRKQGATCPGCGGFASDNDLTGYIEPHIRRWSRFCGFCGMLFDLPIWALRVRIIEESLVVAGSQLTGCVEISNDSAQPLQVTIGATIRGAGEMRAESTQKSRLLIEPGATTSFGFTLVPANAPVELMQMFVFIAHAGAFGVLARMLLFGRGTLSTSSAESPAS